MHLAEVSADDLSPIDSALAVVAIGPTAISVDGEVVLEIANGAVDAALVRRGTIPRLTAYLAAVRAGDDAAKKQALAPPPIDAAVADSGDENMSEDEVAAYVDEMFEDDDVLLDDEVGSSVTEIVPLAKRPVLTVVVDRDVSYRLLLPSCPAQPATTPSQMMSY